MLMGGVPGTDGGGILPNIDVHSRVQTVSLSFPLPPPVANNKRQGLRHTKFVRSLANHIPDGGVTAKVGHNRRGGGRGTVTPVMGGGPNPLKPCGACMEWLKKIAEVNPNFKVVTFTDSRCSGVYIEDVAQIL